MQFHTGGKDMGNKGRAFIQQKLNTKNREPGTKRQNGQKVEVAKLQQKGQDKVQQKKAKYKSNPMQKVKLKTTYHGDGKNMGRGMSVDRG